MTYECVTNGLLKWPLLFDVIPAQLIGIERNIYIYRYIYICIYIKRLKSNCIIHYSSVNMKQERNEISNQFKHKIYSNFTFLYISTLKAEANKATVHVASKQAH